MATSFDKFSTYDEVAATYPQIGAIPNIQTTFDDFILPLVGLNIDTELFNLAPGFYKIGSKLLSMHYIITLIVPEVKDPAGNTVWNPEDFEGRAGAITSLKRGRESISFQSTSGLTNRESNFNETEPGREYQTLIETVRRRIGIDGRGNLWVGIQ